MVTTAETSQMKEEKKGSADDDRDITVQPSPLTQFARPILERLAKNGDTDDISTRFAQNALSVILNQAYPDKILGAYREELKSSNEDEEAAIHGPVPMTLITLCFKPLLTSHDAGSPLTPEDIDNLIEHVKRKRKQPLTSRQENIYGAWEKTLHIYKYELLFQEELTQGGDTEDNSPISILIQRLVYLKEKIKEVNLDTLLDNLDQVDYLVQLRREYEAYVSVIYYYREEKIDNEFSALSRFLPNTSDTRTFAKAYVKKDPDSIYSFKQFLYEFHIKRYEPIPQKKTDTIKTNSTESGLESSSAEPTLSPEKKDDTPFHKLDKTLQGMSDSLHDLTKILARQEPKETYREEMAVVEKILSAKDALLQITDLQKKRQKAPIASTDEIISSINNIFFIMKDWRDFSKVSLEEKSELRAKYDAIINHYDSLYEIFKTIILNEDEVRQADDIQEEEKGSVALVSPVSNQTLFLDHIAPALEQYQQTSCTFIHHTLLAWQEYYQSCKSKSPLHLSFYLNKLLICATHAQAEQIDNLNRAYLTLRSHIEKKVCAAKQKYVGLNGTDDPMPPFILEKVKQLFHTLPTELASESYTSITYNYKALEKLIDFLLPYDNDETISFEAEIEAQLEETTQSSFFVEDNLLPYYLACSQIQTQHLLSLVQEHSSLDASNLNASQKLIACLSTLKDIIEAFDQEKADIKSDDVITFYQRIAQIIHVLHPLCKKNITEKMLQELLPSITAPVQALAQLKIRNKDNRETSFLCIQRSKKLLDHLNETSVDKDETKLEPRADEDETKSESGTDEDETKSESGTDEDELKSESRADEDELKSESRTDEDEIEEKSSTITSDLTINNLDTIKIITTLSTLLFDIRHPSKQYKDKPLDLITQVCDFTQGNIENIANIGLYNVAYELFLEATTRFPQTCCESSCKIPELLRLLAAKELSKIEMLEAKLKEGAAESSITNTADSIVSHLKEQHTHTLNLIDRQEYDAAIVALRWLHQFSFYSNHLLEEKIDYSTFKTHINKSSKRALQTLGKCRKNSRWVKNLATSIARFACWLLGQEYKTRSTEKLLQTKKCSTCWAQHFKPKGYNEYMKTPEAKEEAYQAEALQEEKDSLKNHTLTMLRNM